MAKRTAGLEPAEWSTLCYLAATESASSAELRTHLELQPGSLTNALGTLRDQGLVATTGVAGDKRARAHSLTPSGAALVANLGLAFAAVLGEHLPDP